MAEWDISAEAASVARTRSVGYMDDAGLVERAGSISGCAEWKLGRRLMIAASGGTLAVAALLVVLATGDGTLGARWGSPQTRGATELISRGWWHTLCVLRFQPDAQSIAVT